MTDAFGNVTTDDGVTINLTSDSATTSFSEALIGSNFVSGAAGSVDTSHGLFQVAFENTSVTSEAVQVTAEVASTGEGASIEVNFQDLSAEDTFAGSCSDGVDNDCDGDLDCHDSDCSGSPECQCEAPFFVKGGRCARTYYLTRDEWIGGFNTCSTDHIYSTCGSAPFGFRFLDLPHPGYHAITDIEIETSSGLNCSGTTNRTITVNDVDALTFDYPHTDCNCALGGAILQDLGPVVSQAAMAYTRGDWNELKIANPTSCEGFSTNAAFGDEGFWSVTVTY
jgi:hypothetical protein